MDNKNGIPDTMPQTHRRCAWAMSAGLTLLAAFMFKAKTGPDEFFPKQTQWVEGDSQFLGFLAVAGVIGVVMLFTSSFIGSFTAFRGKNHSFTLTSVAWLLSPLGVVVTLVVMPNLPHLYLGIITGVGALAASMPLLKRAR